MSQASIPDDLRPIVEEVVRRDRRRIRTLAFTTIALWVLAILFIPAVFLPLAAKIKYHLVEAASASATQSLERETIPKLAEAILVVSAIMIGAMLLASLLASICTVALALTIRRVTLRQVTASLAQISEQLRQLQIRGRADSP
jgi:hypothetical protein